MQIAISDLDGKVSLWCYHGGVDEDGFIHFNVINGLWNGKFKDNTVYVEHTKASYPGMIIWVGDAAGLKQHKDNKWSKFPDHCYNEAIAWIQEQIDNPEYVMLPLESVYEYKPKIKNTYNNQNDEWNEDEIPF